MNLHNLINENYFLQPLSHVRTSRGKVNTGVNGMMIRFLPYNL